MECYQIEQIIIDQNNEIDEIRNFVSNQAQSLEIHKIEEELFKRLLNLGKAFLIEALARKGSGKSDSPIYDKRGQNLPFHSIKSRDYTSIFGKIEILRNRYWKKGCKGIYPLDRQLNLPEGQHSYLLNKWIQYRVAEGPYDDAIKSICDLLNVTISKRTVEKMSCHTAYNKCGYYKDESVLRARKEIT